MSDIQPFDNPLAKYIVRQDGRTTHYIIPDSVLFEFNLPELKKQFEEFWMEYQRGNKWYSIKTIDKVPQSQLLALRIAELFKD